MKAVVDIGSNTIKYELSRDRNGALEILKKNSFPAALGRDFSGKLQPEALERAQKALLLLREEIPPDCPLAVVATAAVREAQNQEIFLDLCQKCLGQSPRVLTGLEEAHYSFLGALPDGEAAEGFIFVDVGGASTEVGILKKDGIQAQSLKIGAVLAHDQFFGSRCKLNKSELKWGWEKTKEFIDAYSTFFKKLPPRDHLIAIGGTLNKAAQLIKAPINRHGDRRVSKSELLKLVDRLAPMSLEERINFSGLSPERAEIVCSGMILLIQLMDQLKHENCHITSRGLRRGILKAASYQQIQFSPFKV